MKKRELITPFDNFGNGVFKHDKSNCFLCNPELSCDCPKSQWEPVHYGYLFCSETGKSHHGGYHICRTCGTEYK
jgi:hypothetical protein